MKFPVLETNRLLLRKIIYDDVSDIFEYLSNDLVTKYLGKESLTSIKNTYEVIDKIEKNYSEGRGIRWGIVHKKENKLIGTIGYDGIQIKNKRADIGYDINSNYWRQGYATEAINEVISFGFSRLCLSRIGAVVFPDNKASLSLLEKVGFTKEGLLREYIIQNNIAKDTVVLSLLKNEYQKNRNDFYIRDIEFNDIDEAFDVVKNVFIEFDAPDYSKEGVDEFINQIINNKEFINKFKTGEQLMIGAFDSDKLIGVLAISKRNHVSLVFVDKEYHRMGVATSLFNEIIKRVKLNNVNKIKLNSSPYALEFYKNIGFIATDTEQTKSGIRYTPMELLL